MVEGFELFEIALPTLGGVRIVDRHEHSRRHTAKFGVSNRHHEFQTGVEFPFEAAEFVLPVEELD